MAQQIIFYDSSFLPYPMYMNNCNINIVIWKLERQEAELICFPIEIPFYMTPPL